MNRDGDHGEGTWHPADGSPDGDDVDLGSVACVGGGLDWDRVTDHLLEPIARCMTVPSRFFLGKYTTDPDYGSASGGEWRDVMDPDPACLP